MTECTPEQLEFQHLGRRSVVGRFDGGRISSDAGGLLLREVDQRIGLIDRIAGCFIDCRQQKWVEHPVRNLVAQRIFGIALGYEDLNDHEQLRRDPVLAAMVGSTDPEGNDRRHERDKGCPLAGPNTLDRLELSRPGTVLVDRYKKIAADMDALDELFVEVFQESQSVAPEEIWLDLDATDDKLHGQQEGRHYNAYYDSYCYLPLYIFCDEHLLCARLRTADKDASDGAEQELMRIVEQIRQRWPSTRINIRADSGFCRDGIMSWCEQNDVGFLLGIQKNARLERAIKDELFDARAEHRDTGEAVRHYADFRYRTLDSWSAERRVVGKAEILTDGTANPRFVVTNLSRTRIGARRLYEELYCIRGEMENRIKEQQLCLFADRTSSELMSANQLRLYFSSFAYVLMHGIRRLGLQDTELEKAQCSTIRLKLLKIGARVSISVRRLQISFSESYPFADVFRTALANVQSRPLWLSSG